MRRCVVGGPHRCVVGEPPLFPSIPPIPQGGPQPSALTCDTGSAAVWQSRGDRRAGTAESWPSARSRCSEDRARDAAGTQARRRSPSARPQSCSSGNRYKSIAHEETHIHREREKEKQKERTREGERREKQKCKEGGGGTQDKRVKCLKRNNQKQTQKP